MLKHIILKISSIKYTGKSIGDDIRVEVNALGKFWAKDKQIKRGTTKSFTKENIIGQFVTDQSTYTIPIEIKIIEKDWILNDFGELNTNIEIDLASFEKQNSIHTVKVVENRWKFVLPEAFFDVSLTYEIQRTIRCISEQEDGWLSAKTNNVIVALPAFLKVKYEYEVSGREYFTILEGPYHGQKASVKFNKEGKSYLTEDLHISSAHLTYSISKKELQFNEKTYKTTDYSGSQWRKGFYDIEIPDAPHEMDERYLEKASKAKVWFRIGHSGEKYLHTGSVSAGCITIIEHDRWDELYSMLINARTGDSKSVGVLEVID